MAWLEVYSWEKSKWPWQQRVMVRPDMRESVADELAHLMGVTLDSVRLNKRSGGQATYRNIRLPMVHLECSLGLIMHEVAHLVNAQVYHGKGHKGTFKQALIKVYIESRPHLKRILLSALEKSNRVKLDALRVVEKVEREAQKANERKQLRKTRAYKIEQLRKRIRRLDTRIKRLSTMRASAARSLRAYERAEAIKPLGVLA